jgi:hypothetical protein
MLKFLPTKIDRRSNLNSSGYRCPEFDSIDWNNSLIIFGCSAVFGTELLDNETIDFYLSRILNKPVINMGVPATSMLYSFYNQITLAEREYNPLAVINLWTSAERQMYFLEGNVINFGPWIDTTVHPHQKLKNLHNNWLDNKDNLEANALLIKRLAMLIWKNTRHYQASFFADTAKLLSVEHLDIIDRAKDNKHPGSKTAKAVAEKIANWFINGTLAQPVEQ